MLNLIKFSFARVLVKLIYLNNVDLIDLRYTLQAIKYCVRRYSIFIATISFDANKNVVCTHHQRFSLYTILYKYRILIKF